MNTLTGNSAIVALQSELTAAISIKQPVNTREDYKAYAKLETQVANFVNRYSRELENGTIEHAENIAREAYQWAMRL